MNFFAIFLMNFDFFLWFYSILAGWSTWQWVFLYFSQNFWSFDTLDTPGCASAVIWNHCLKQIWAIPPTVSSFFLSLRKITWLNSQQPKTKAYVEHLSKIYHWLSVWTSNATLLSGPFGIYLFWVRKYHWSPERRNSCQSDFCFTIIQNNLYLWFWYKFGRYSFFKKRKVIGLLFKILKG